ncbi:hypothetical protein, partial [Streptomyces sp. NPDC127092]|uniref:hypothetical protein n=1 Tax=Streptomyces sp. NPDC127092 TaxID=3347135 RepID=UPI00365A59F7
INTSRRDVCAVLMRNVNQHFGEAISRSLSIWIFRSAGTLKAFSLHDCADDCADQGRADGHANDKRKGVYGLDVCDFSPIRFVASGVHVDRLCEIPDE